MENFEIGIDIENIDRFIKLIKNEKFLTKIFTSHEIELCFKKNRPEESFAARFACKEAVRKTIAKTLPFNKIEILNNKLGKPQVKLLDKSLEKQYYLKASLSHTKDFACAVCLTFKNDQKKQ